MTSSNTTPTPAVPTYPQQVTGMDILVRALKMVGIDTMYGLVGIPVTEVAYIAQARGIRFISFRHEQQAGMAAATHGFLTGKPGVCLTVSSLGFLNGLTATANATVNCYPMIQISGSSVREPIDLRQPIAPISPKTYRPPWSAPTAPPYPAVRAVYISISPPHASAP